MRRLAPSALRSGCHVEIPKDSDGFGRILQRRWQEVQRLGLVERAETARRVSGVGADRRLGEQAKACPYMFKSTHTLFTCV